MTMANNPMSNKRFKHDDLNYHPIRDYTDQGIMELKYVCRMNTVLQSNKNTLLLTFCIAHLERLNHNCFTNMLL